MRSIKLSLTALSLAMLCVGQGVGALAQTCEKQAMMDALFEDSHLLYKSMILDKYITFDMTPAWCQRMNDAKGVHSLVYVTRDIGNFGKKMGWGDPEDIELCFDGTKDEARPKVQGVVDQFSGKVAFAVEAKSPTVTDEQFALAIKYMEAVGEVLGREDWKPASGVALVKLVLSPTAKGLTAKPEPDGKHFTVVAPVNTEPNAIVRTISDGFRRKPTSVSLNAGKR